MHADTYEQKRREPENDVHAGCANDCGEAIGKSVAKINRDGHDPRTDQSCGQREDICTEVVGLVCAQRDCGRNGARPDGERQREGIKGAAKNVGGIHVFLDLAAFVGVFLLKHGPAVGDDDESTADLHYGDGDAEEGENVRTDEVGGDDQKEAVERDAAGEEAPGGSGVVGGEREEDRTATDWIDDGEEGANDEQDTFGGFEQGKPRGESIAEEGKTAAGPGGLALG